MQFKNLNDKEPIHVVCESFKLPLRIKVNADFSREKNSYHFT
jgi:hypothetical protein